MASTLQSPPETVLQSVLEVYERGLTLDALRRAEAFAPLRQWAGVKGSLLAARIAANSGGSRLALRLAVRSRRTDPNHPEAQAHYCYELLHRRGPLVMRDFLRSRSATTTVGDSEPRGELLALQGIAASDLRDFDAAEKFIAEAETVAPNKAWIRLQRAHLLERLDRVEEALELATAACGFHPHPHYRPGVQVRAHLLQLLDRDEDAIQLLSDAGQVLQNGPVAAQLYSLFSENGRWAEAGATLDRYVALSPLMEPNLRKWVASQRSRVAYHLGQREEAARFAAELDDQFHKGFVTRVSSPAPERERIQLDVTFVRQHFKTCAPATLAAIGKFWKLPSEHLKLAEAMCYDGTPHWQQRQWAEQNGWVAREFRVTAASATALIEAGIPFAISVVEATSAHMMAVMGLDRTRDTLFLRDPGQPYVIEATTAEFLKRYQAFGPHGTVFLPAQESARLEGITLPDAELYDLRHRFWLALVKHDRNAAEGALVEMEKNSPEHAVVLDTRLDLASYDANNSEQLRCLDRLLELFPADPARRLRRLGCMRDASRTDRLQFLERACAAKEADPALWIELARTLEDDARQHARAWHWLKRALRFRPLDSSAIGVKADLLWAENRLEEATELYRVAANLEGFRENLYQSWFIACRRTRRADEAMAHLLDRFKRFGARSEQPALTLAWAWREMEQPQRAREVLTEAARLRPDDAFLLLRSASLVAHVGEDGEADRLLAVVEGRVRKNDWLRAAAEIAESRLDAATALQRAREILEIEPLALDAHAGVARSLARLEGKAAALAHLQSATQKFPHHLGLQHMLVEWNRDGDSADVEQAVRNLVQLDGADAWARRELATVLSRQDRHEEALREAEEAARIEPNNSFSFSILGHVHRRLNNLAEARAKFRRAVELNADNQDALHTLLNLASTDAERRAELAFIEKQLTAQVVEGDGLLTFVDLARPVVPDDALLKLLRDSHAARPDLWHAWAALVSQLGHLNQLDDALAIATQACERFPHLPRLWLDLAEVRQWRNEPEEELAAAKTAFEINPGWSRAALCLADVFERRGKLHDAKRIYERALLHAGRDPQLHACQAHLLWRLRQKDAAFAAIERALRLAPGYDWAWRLLDEWSGETGEINRPGFFARKLTRERPGEMRVWLMLANVLRDGELPERLAAAQRAIELEPLSVEAWDLKAELLARAERFDEAVRACDDGAARCRQEEYVLRGRKAWVAACRNQRDDAIRQMRAVLDENSGYVWGWDMLVHWLVQSENFDEAATALEQLRRLRPHEGRVSRQLGFLRLKKGDFDGARNAFAEAVKLAPTDVSSAQNLFDLQLKKGAIEDAAATLKVMQVHQPGAGTMALEIRLRLQREEKAEAIKLLEKLCRTPDPDSWPLDTAGQAFARVGYFSSVMRVFKRALRSRECNPQVAAAAIRLLRTRQSHFTAVRLFLKLAPGELSRRAAIPLLEGLTESKSTWLFRFLFWRRGREFFKDDDAWGLVGYALNLFKRHRAAARWLRDWRGRKDVQPWMLFNYCLSLRWLGRYDEANAVARHVQETWGHRRGAADLRLFLAVEEALAGNVPEALLHKKLAVARENVAYDQDIMTLASAAVEFLQIPVAERPAKFSVVRKKLEERFTTGRMPGLDRDVRRTFRRVGRMMAGEGGGAGVKWWFGWKLNWPWLLIPAIPLCVALAVVFPPVVLVPALVALLRSRTK